MRPDQGTRNPERTSLQSAEPPLPRVASCSRRRGGWDRATSRSCALATRLRSLGL